MIIGRQIGPYRILACRSLGDLGPVYKALHTISRDVHGLKILRQPGSSEISGIDAFKNIILAANVDHYHLLKQYPAESADGLTLLPFRHLDGIPLTCRLGQGPASFDFALDIGLHTADVLSSLHEKNLLHGRLTAGALFLSAADHLYVAGAGWSWKYAAWDISEEEDPLCQSRSERAPSRKFAASAYLSPEQVRGEPANARSELYSLGVILYELLTGEYLFNGKTEEEVRSQILEKPIPMLNVSRPEAPVIWPRLIKALLVRDPARRYPSAREVVNDLQQMRWGFSIEHPAFLQKESQFNRRSFFRRFKPDIDI